MVRAANSVHSNIAEGNGRASVNDYLRHLSMSSASLNELGSDLHFLSRKYGERLGAGKALNLVVETRKPLLGLIKSLRRKRDENE
ncbi:MAG TPA: four helix bundle protein [Gemmatimonadaceae bacterium]|nr:four helix bundle protein [Gemmatimonadaceae bacterium]